MLNVLGRAKQNCGGINRRELLQAGGAGLLGLSLPKLLAAEEQGREVPARAKNVIFMFLFGGPSQLETFDMKPEAPEKVRGPFQPIASRTPGLRICEHLPRTADLSDRLCVIRTMSHSYNDHRGDNRAKASTKSVPAVTFDFPSSSSSHSRGSSSIKAPWQTR